MSAAAATATEFPPLTRGVDPELDRAFAAVTRQMRADAGVMDRRHNALQAAQVGSMAWHRAGIDFLREGLKRGCMDHLNKLGDMIGPRSTLSERATDTLFENFAASDAFIAHLRIAAAKDKVFEHHLRAYYGDGLFSRTLKATHPSHPDYIAPSIPDRPAPTPPVEDSPQLGLAFA